jgi:proline iminopeptidase
MYTRILGFKIYYRSFGRATKGTIVGLHGGPGLPHEYLVPLTDLVPYGYKVILYDQMGAGRSEVARDRGLFTVERYVEELEFLRRKLELGKITVLGSGWGGILAIAYALKYQRKLKALITSGGISSVPYLCSELAKRRAELPSLVQSRLKKYESLGNYQNKEYQTAVRQFYKRYICRLPEWPKEVKYSFDHVGKVAYHTMWGPNEFLCHGNLMYWDMTSKLKKIRTPSLIMSGRYDEITPNVARVIHRGIKKSKLVVLPNSSWLSMWEERRTFIQVIRRFLDSIY